MNPLKRKCPKLASSYQIWGDQTSPAVHLSLFGCSPALPISVSMNRDKTTFIVSKMQRCRCWVFALLNKLFAFCVSLSRFHFVQPLRLPPKAKS
jgi:hypothetical protein